MTFSLFLLVPYFSIAQKSFEGQIIYHIKYEQLPEEWQPYEEQLPDSMWLQIQGSKSRLVQDQGSNTYQIRLVDTLERTIHNLFNAYGKDVCLYFTPEDVKLNDSLKSKAELTPVKKQKEICGLNCPAMLVQFEDEQPFELYYTPTISNSYHTEFYGLRYLPMQYKSTYSGFVVTMTAVAIEERKWPEDHMVIPERYTLMNLEEFEKSLGQ